jgi:hypothetical protein
MIGKFLGYCKYCGEVVSTLDEIEEVFECPCCCKRSEFKDLIKENEV